MLDRGSILLFRVRGVPIRGHWTLLLVLPYLAYVMAVQFGMTARTAGVPPEELALPPWVWGLLLAVSLLASVVLHELAHVAVATRYGGKVRGITLMLLGGVSHITRMPSRPRDEGLMALAGPATSLGLGALLLVGLSALRGGSPDLRMAVFYLGSINILLGLFNLLPAFPMDGGRILRAVLAARMGTVRATRTAATVGRVLAVAMGIYGVWAGSLMLMLIALFVFVGAGSEAAAASTRAALAGLDVASLVPAWRRVPETIALDAPLAEALPRMRELGRPALIVAGPGGDPIGVLEASDVARAPLEQRLTGSVRDLAPRLRNRHILVQPGEAAVDAIERAAETGARHLILLDPRGLALVSTPDIAAALELELARGDERERSATAPHLGGAGAR